VTCREKSEKKMGRKKRAAKKELTLEVEVRLEANGMFE
jgi:hypothetical protein